MRAIRFCSTSKTYTMKGTCPDGGPSTAILPPKYSPEDKYAKYRRMAKSQKSP